MISRTLTAPIQKIAQGFPVVLLTGPRQVGKTTLLQDVAGRKYRYVSLDDMVERDLASRDPALFIQKHRPPVVIDEVQYAPELFPYIKLFVDRHPGCHGQFLLTGSQKFHLMRGMQESLAGRVAILDLLGLSRREKAGRPKTPCFLPSEKLMAAIERAPIQTFTVQDVFEDIWKGSFPRLVSQQNKYRDVFYRSYIQTYISRDIKDVHAISDELTFFHFIKAAAARTGQLLNFAELARDLGIDPKTSKAWLQILELSGLVKLLYPYYNNITKRITKTPKLYFLDTGLCAYLTGWDSPRTLEAGAMSGAILETYIFSEILKSYWHNGKEPMLYFYRDKEQREIDFVIEANGCLHPIEVKKTLMPNSSMVKHFAALEALKKPVGHGCVICCKPTPFPLSPHITAIPVWSI